MCAFLVAACDGAADGTDAVSDAGPRDASQVNDAGDAARDAEPADARSDEPPPPVDLSDAGTDPAPSVAYDGCPIHVSVATESYGTGNNDADDYAPNNVGAIWITDANGAFVRTIAVWGPNYWQFAATWVKQSGGSRVDIVAGATRRNHAKNVEAEWDCRDKQLALVSPGSYRLNVEFTEVEEQGPLLSGDSSLSFVVGPKASDVMRAPGDSFGLIRLSVAEP